MSDPEEELFEADFAGDWESLPHFDVPPLEELPMAGADLIHRRLGVDIADESITPLKKMAAVEWFFRRRAGQQVTFTQVYRGGNAAADLMAKAGAKESTSEGEEADPTLLEGGTGSGSP